MLTSVVAMYRPTQRPDKLLEDALPGPPTTLRQFPEGGSVAVYAEVYDNQLDRPHDIEWTVVVAGEHGDVMYRTAETHAAGELKESGGVVRVKVGIPLVKHPAWQLHADGRRAPDGQPGHLDGSRGAVSGSSRERAIGTCRSRGSTA